MNLTVIFLNKNIIKILVIPVRCALCDSSLIKGERYQKFVIFSSRTYEHLENPEQRKFSCQRDAMEQDGADYVNFTFLVWK